jgi:hypothetical protein
MLHTDPDQLSQIIKFESLSKDFKKKTEIESKSRRRRSRKYMKELANISSLDKQSIDSRRQKKLFYEDDGLPFASLVEIIAKRMPDYPKQPKMTLSVSYKKTFEPYFEEYSIEVKQMIEELLKDDNYELGSDGSYFVRRNTYLN